MMRFRTLWVLTGASMLGALGLAGCGVSGQLRATPTGQGNYTITGRVQTTPSPGAIAATTAPASRATGTPDSDGATTTPSSPPPASPNPTTTTSPGTLTGWPTSVTEALQWEQGHTTGLPLEGPAWVPSAPSALSAHASTDSANAAYTVGLWETTTALPVNSPQISTQSPNAAPLAGWTVEAMAGAPNPAMLEAGNSEWIQPTGADQSVALGNGITGTAYSHGISGQNVDQTTLIVWHEGAWTWEVSGPTMSADQSQAESVVAYLHQAYLPPAPGVGAVEVTGQGARTELVWQENGTQVRLMDDIPSPSNPLDTAHMAVSWRIRL